MTEVKTAGITRDIIENGYTYPEYRELINRLMEQDKTTGDNHSEAMLHYTKMNVHRMNRLDKKTEIAPRLFERLTRVERPLTWLILTEAWCGDAAQALPAVQKMADVTKKIQTRYILRDEHLEIMDQFLTNGRSRSVPKLICLDSQTLDVLGTWGPRPETAQVLYDEWRSKEGVKYPEVAEKLHKWYSKDKTNSVQKEILRKLDEWERR